MKTAAKKILKVLIIMFLMIVLTLAIIPVFFKAEIEQAFKTEINKNINAKVDFNKLRLSLLTSFPDLRLQVDDLVISGVDIYESDTLFRLDKLKLGLDLMSLIRKTGIEIKEITLSGPVIRLVIPEKGRPNWDIMKESEPASEDTTRTDTELTVQLKKFEINDAALTYQSVPDEIYVSLQHWNLLASGKAGAEKIRFQINNVVESVLFKSGGIAWLNQVKLEWKGSMEADLDRSVYSLTKQSFFLNAMKLNLDGTVDLSETDPHVDLEFHADDNRFESLLSLIPVLYLKDYQDLKAAGNFSLSASVKGTYVESDSTYPDARMELKVEDGSFSYPELPASMKKVNLLLKADVKGDDLDKTALDVEAFSFELAGNPFNSEWHIRTPLSDPQMKAVLKTRLQLADFTGLLDMEDLIISGDLDADLKFDVKMSDIEAGNYANTKAEGYLNLENFKYESSDLSLPVEIGNASLKFSPEELSVPACAMKIGQSDLFFEGNFTNYLLYYLKDDLLQGTFSLKSGFVNAVELMSLYQDTTAAMVSSGGNQDTITYSSMAIPENLDLKFHTSVKKLSYGDFKPENLKGQLSIRNRKLSIENFSMGLFDGSVHASGFYDTSDTLRPEINMNLSVKSLDIPDAFHSFHTLQSLAPFAKSMKGKVFIEFAYSGSLGKDMNPVISTMNGKGKLRTEGVQVVDAKLFEMMKGLLKMDPSYTTGIKDFIGSFEVKDGNVVVPPFDIMAGDIKMNISGEHGLDQHLNYLIKTEIPGKELGTAANGVIDGLSDQAKKLGINFEPGEIIPVNFRLKGKIKNPVLSIESFGKRGGANLSESVKKEVKIQIEKEKEKLVEEVKSTASDEAEKILKEAETEAEKIKELAAEAAETMRREANNSADQIIKEAEGKGAIAMGLAKIAAAKVREQGEKQAENLMKEADEKSKMVLDTARKKVKELK
jgi:hypothetical protein